jgi:hypothetical protein
MKNNESMVNIVDKETGEVVGKMSVKDAILLEETRKKEKYKKMDFFQKIKFQISEHELLIIGFLGGDR